MPITVDKKKHKSARQVRFLMSKVSPLTEAQKKKMVGEMHSGHIIVDKKPPPRAGRK